MRRFTPALLAGLLAGLAALTGCGPLGPAPEAKFVPLQPLESADAEKLAKRAMLPADVLSEFSMGEPDTTTRDETVMWGGCSTSLPSDQFKARAVQLSWEEPYAGHAGYVYTAKGSNVITEIRQMVDNDCRKRRAADRDGAFTEEITLPAQTGITQYAYCTTERYVGQENVYYWHNCQVYMARELRGASVVTTFALVSEDLEKAKTFIGRVSGRMAEQLRKA
ncbi:hypothetical protein [Longispora albida]|uniref:hypothetical protein n=1 Tax=Longispora albida TaxID=203523 RepID=UPI00036F59D4|nr:hypothetical protein [Longispora albida]